MQENKYFQPEISDMRVGYRCEYNKSDSHTYEDWNSIIIEPQDFYNGIITDFGQITFSKNLRVPYLTKEQIEAEGWKLYFGENQFKKDDWLISVYDYTDNRNLSFSKGAPPFWLNFYYHGECKDINTFRYITKLLGI